MPEGSSLVLAGKFSPVLVVVGGSLSFISGGFFLMMAKDSSGLVVGPPLEVSWADSSLVGICSMAHDLLQCLLATH